MNCATCGLVWDVNDPEPPECGLNVKQPTDSHDKAIRDIGEALKMIDSVMILYGLEWRVSAIAKGLIVLTLASVIGEPTNSNQIKILRT